MLVLTRDDVRQLIRIESIIEAVQAAHGALARGEASQAIDQPTPLPSAGGVMLPMAAMIRAPPVLGVKVLSDVPSNSGRGLRRQHSSITLLDPTTGQPLALLDGIEITLQRTAAASAVATRHLARADVHTLGFVGAGAQARSHLAALTRVRSFERVVVWSRTRATAERFAGECDAVAVEVLDTVEAVVREADVLCTLTPSREPLVRGEWLRPGMHINAVGAPPRPDHREVDSEGVRRSVIVVDDLASSLDRSGEICVPIAEGVLSADDIHGDLGQVVAGLRPGRSDAEEITLFNSVGLALQDVAAAGELVRAASRAGVGVEVALS